MDMATTPMQLPIRLRKGTKTQVRTQFSSLCFRQTDAGPEFCLITSRGTGRWVLPKGWPMHNTTPAQAASIEAWEEAGLTGDAYDHCLGVYSYHKVLKKRTVPVVVMVYPMLIKEEHDAWPERRERARLWVSRADAAEMLAEPELKQIVRGFNPATLHGFPAV